ncbi:MAG: hypothetical protein KDD51_02835 [Bdellovibrionales bacterium]|nr:hypothetical protein [Bdellovibrionales bacterium]
MAKRIGLEACPNDLDFGPTASIWGFREVVEDSKPSRDLKGNSMDYVFRASVFLAFFCICAPLPAGVTQSALHFTDLKCGGEDNTCSLSCQQGYAHEGPMNVVECKLRLPLLTVLNEPESICSKEISEELTLGRDCLELNGLYCGHPSQIVTLPDGRRFAFGCQQSSYSSQRCGSSSAIDFAAYIKESGAPAYALVAKLNRPEARYDAFVGMVGNQVLIYHGERGRQFCYRGKSETTYAEGGAIYDVDSDSWTTISNVNAPPAPSARMTHSFVMLPPPRYSDFTYDLSGGEFKVCWKDYGSRPRPGSSALSSHCRSLEVATNTWK